jgi:hypothetical protein
MSTKGLLETLKVRDHSEDLVIHGIILNWILGKQHWKVWIRLI